MNCTEFDKRLQTAVELRRSVDDPLVASHAVNCRRCRERWERHLLLEEALAEWRERLPLEEVDLTDAVLGCCAFEKAPDLSSSVSTGIETASVGGTVPVAQLDDHGFPGGSHVRAERSKQPAIVLTDPRPTVHSRRGLLAVLAVVAVVLVVVAQPFGLREGAEQPVAAVKDVAPQSRPAMIAETESVAAESGAGGDTETDVSTFVRGAGSAYLGLARETAVVFSDAVALIPTELQQGSGRAETAASADNEEDSALPFSRQLQPIGRDVGQAIEFLFQTMTTEEEPAT